MLLTNRRHRLLFGALAGMELAWLLPFLLLFLNLWVREPGQGATPFFSESAALGNAAAAGRANAQLAELLMLPALAIFAFFWLLMIFYMLAADTLNSSPIESPGRELVLAALILGTALLSARLLLYATTPLLDFGWFGNFFNALFNFQRGRRPEPALLLINLLLWFRVAALTGRELTFFSVGLSFRAGLLLAIFGAGLLNRFASASSQDSLVFLALFFAFGLTAVALARMDDKALRTADSRGALLPWARFGQILAAVGVILGLAWGAAQLYTPQTLRTILAWFSPLWDFLGVIASRILFGIAWLLAPLLERMIAFLRSLLEMSGIFESTVQPAPLELPEAAPLTQLDLGAMLDQWSFVRYGLIFAGLLVALAFIWLFFMRTPERSADEESEEYGAEPRETDGNLLQRGMQRLRDWAELVRRYGVGTQLLAAISVQNIYANVARLAKQRGFPRAPSQPPDQYLPLLVQAFPGCADALERITGAYMQVEYGDRPANEAQLTQLRADFDQVRHAPALPPTSTAEPISS